MQLIEVDIAWRLVLGVGLVWRLVWGVPTRTAWTSSVVGGWVLVVQCCVRAVRCLADTCCFMLQLLQ